MSTPLPDIIDLLATVPDGTPIEGLRALRPQARIHAQKSHTDLFAPLDASHFSVLDRYVVAAFVAGLHRDETIIAFYREALRDAGGQPDLVAALDAEISSALTEGPYGHYPEGPLTPENQPGPAYGVANANAAILGPRLTAAFTHVHLLVFHPRDAAARDLQVLLDAGWTEDGIVTLSQLVAFLSFQIRAITGLRTLAASKTPEVHP